MDVRINQQFNPITASGQRQLKQFESERETEQVLCYSANWVLMSPDCWCSKPAHKCHRNCRRTSAQVLSFIRIKMMYVWTCCSVRFTWTQTYFDVFPWQEQVKPGSVVMSRRSGVWCLVCSTLSNLFHRTTGLMYKMLQLPICGWNCKRQANEVVALVKPRWRKNRFAQFAYSTWDGSEWSVRMETKNKTKALDHRYWMYPT